MALALLWPDLHEGDTNALRLRFDIGRNRYYAWELGGEERLDTNGITRIADVEQRSRLFGPLPQSVRGRGVLEISRDLVTRERRFAQLWSFRDADGVGPAISSIVELEWSGARREPGRMLVDQALPPPAFFVAPAAVAAGVSSGSDGGLATMMATEYSSARPMPVDAVPLRYRERRDLSQGMFLQGLLAALPSILPRVAPMIGSLISSAAPAIGQLLGGLTSGTTGAAAGGGAPAAGGGAAGAAAGGSAQLTQVIEQLLRSIAQSRDGTAVLADVQRALTGSTGAATHATAPAPVAAQSIAFGTLGARAARCAPKDYERSSAAAVRARRTPRAIQYARAQGYSEAMVAPALLAALPALMPLLQQVLSPQNIQTLVDAPQRATGQIINGLMDFAKIGMQAHEAEREHLRQLNPGVDDPALNQLLMSMSQGFAAAQRLNYRRVASVKLSFDGAQTQTLFGRSRVLYRIDRALQFPMSVTTPQTITQARLVLQIKHPDTLAVLVDDSEEIGDLSSGPIPLVPRVDETQVARLTPNQDYIVVATLLWRTRKGSRVGTSMQQRITLIGEYSFDHVEEGDEPVAASDFREYRDFWHKVWEGDFGPGARSVRLACRYYLALNPKRTNNARMDTHLESDDDAKLGGKLKTGTEYSPYVLNHLLTRLAPSATPLDDAELEALCGADFVERFNQAAQFSGKLKGRRGERGALWVYPEFKVQTLVLTRAEEVDENGNVRTLNERRVQFPMPVILHFVGVKGA